MGFDHILKLVAFKISLYLSEKNDIKHPCEQVSLVSSSFEVRHMLFIESGHGIVKLLFPCRCILSTVSKFVI